MNVVILSRNVISGTKQANLSTIRCRSQQAKIKRSMECDKTISDILWYTFLQYTMCTLDYGVGGGVRRQQGSNAGVAERPVVSLQRCSMLSTRVEGVCAAR